jgi:hypothetical protein
LAYVYYDDRRGGKTSLSANFAVSTAIAHALLAQFILMSASPSQLRTFPTPMPILSSISVAAYSDAPRSNLNLLRIRRNGERQSCRSSDGECVFAHSQFSYFPLVAFRHRKAHD